MYMTLMEPPYEFAPVESTLLVEAMHLKQGASMMLTLRSIAVVTPHSVMLLEFAFVSLLL
jgi:hypothetical protein